MGIVDFLIEKKDENEIKKNENSEIKQSRRKLKTAKSELKSIREQLDILNTKYISILEEKGDAFNQYLYWQNKANEAEAEEKELRKEINDIKKELREYNEVIGKLFNKEPITSLMKCETLEDFLAYALRLYFTDKDLPLKGIKDTCKKLEITKNMIKKESEFLYKQLGVDKWDIEE